MKQLLHGRLDVTLCGHRAINRIRLCIRISREDGRISGSVLMEIHVVMEMCSFGSRGDGWRRGWGAMWASRLVVSGRRRCEVW